MILKIVTLGKYKRELDITPISHNRFKLKFNYDPELIAEVKVMEGGRWHPEEKYWSIANSPRNQFVLNYLSGKNPYAYYDQPLIEYSSNRPLMNHQLMMVRVGLTYRMVIISADPGTGKTLAAIEIMEKAKCDNILWVGPKSALRAVEVEFLKWESKVWPTLVTYDSLKKHLDKDPPELIVFDECQKIRNPSTQRASAARDITLKMREEYDNPYIIEMSGTVSPTDPSGWWMPAEIACPGYIKEGNIFKFKNRLALIVQKESMVGGAFPELITWWDDEKKCKKCGKYADAEIHQFELFYPNYHEWQASINEVEYLYKRLKGLVHIWRKKDCLDLPDKNYRIIKCEPSQDTLRAAKLILANAKSIVSANMLLRELSDGFQYQEVASGTKTCPLCEGRGIMHHPDAYVPTECITCEAPILNYKCVSCAMDYSPEEYVKEDMPCIQCGGEGEIPNYIREAKQVPCPKEDIVKELLEEHEELGRIVFYAGFQGSLERLTTICSDAGWEWMRVDGRGWISSLGHVSEVNMLRTFQDKKRKIPRFAFIGNPDAGGLGLTLTESPTIAFYSNSFVPESRLQAVERIHRPGMDYNRGANIIDICHLPSDYKVLENLNKSKTLMEMSLGEMVEAFR